MPATTCDEQVPPSPHEEIPLLSSRPPARKAARVPWSQVRILLVLLLAEPLTSQVIYPFTPEVCRILYSFFVPFFCFSFSNVHLLQFVRNVGISHGNESCVGIYVGMMVRAEVDVYLPTSLSVVQYSVFFAAQAITVLLWGRLSDVVGRKPVVLVGLFGLSLSMFGFGLSTTYRSAALWQVSMPRPSHPTSHDIFQARTQRSPQWQHWRH